MSPRYARESGLETAPVGRRHKSAATVPANPGKRFFSRREVAQLFDVSAHTVYRWTREGRLPYVMTPGGRRRYPREDIDRLAASWLKVRQGTDNRMTNIE